jgi:hypothetical protein
VTRFSSFAEFYPFYLSEHRHPMCRRLHFLGSTVAIVCVLAAILDANPWWVVAAPVAGYGFAWAGHAFFERNRPATFKHPLYSFVGDWAMYRDMLTRRIPWR